MQEKKVTTSGNSAPAVAAKRCQRLSSRLPHCLFRFPSAGKRLRCELFGECASRVVLPSAEFAANHPRRALRRAL
jgi:hypothetical protein